MLFGRVMFASRVRHMHQCGYILHLLFQASECDLSVEAL